MVKSQRNNKRQNIVQLISLLAILVFINILSGYFFKRIDLTSEHRYSLSPSSKQLAANLNDVVYFKIYLEGNLPPGFKKLRNSIKEILDEYRIYSKGNIEYEFIDPSSNPDEKERVKFFRQLASKGLSPTNLQERDKAGQTQQIIFPGAIVNYRAQEIPLQFLKSKINSSPEEMLNHSIEELEYEISSTLRKIVNVRADHIGILQGQDELSTKHLADAANTLAEYYSIDTIDIKEQINALKDYKALIIAKPETAFSEKDKFIIDQFIMHGGRVLWLIDQMAISMDSLNVSGTNVAIPLTLNLDDMLFKYGVRINPDLVLDMQAAPIPIVTGNIGNQPKQEIFPWYYFPLFMSDADHPIVHNLNAIKGEFVSSIDTIETENIKKTILLTSSHLTRIQQAPARVSLNILSQKPDPKEFPVKNIPVAVLLEGKFESNYKKRIPEQIASSPEIGFKESSDQNKMIVISDGDIISNFVSKKGTMYPLGYDRISDQTYGNKNFILNCVDYLCDANGVLELRAKEFRLRLLDRDKVDQSGVIKWLAVVLPLILLFLFGIIFTYFRKRKFQYLK